MASTGYFNNIATKQNNNWNRSARCWASCGQQLILGVGGRWVPGLFRTQKNGGFAMQRILVCHKSLLLAPCTLATDPHRLILQNVSDPILLLLLLLVHTHTYVHPGHIGCPQDSDRFNHTYQNSCVHFTSISKCTSTHNNNLFIYFTLSCWMNHRLQILEHDW